VRKPAIVFLSLVVAASAFGAFDRPDARVYQGKNLDAVGVRVEFKVVPTQDLFKEAAQGKFQINIHGRGGGPRDLRSMLIRSGQKENLLAFLAMIARQNIRLYLFQSMANMRLGIHVIYGCGYIKLVIFV